MALGVGWQLTQTWREEHHIQIRHKLLLLRIEHALSCDDIARHADADDLQDGLEDEENEVAKIGFSLIVHHDRLLESIESPGRKRPADDGSDAIIAICESE